MFITEWITPLPNKQNLLPIREVKYEMLYMNIPI